MKKLIVLFAMVLVTQLVAGQAKVTLKETLSERKHQIVCVAYSPDSKLIATGGFDNQIILWNSATGQVFKTLTGLKAFPLSLTFSHDSRYIISGGKDSRVTIWDANTGAEIRSIKAHGADVTDVAIRSDNTIASASKDKTVKVWDFNGTLKRELTGHKREVMAVAFSHDGEKLVSGSADGTVKEWEVATGKMIQSIDAHDGWVRTVAYNHNSTQIASGGDDGKINIWNRSSGKLQNTIIAHSKWLETLSFSPDGKYIVSGGHDNYLVIVEASSGKIVFNSPKQEYYVLSTAFDPSGKHIISCALNSTNLSVWDVSSLLIAATIPQDEKPKVKPSISWKISNNQQTENLSFRVSAGIKTESPISTVEVFLNNNRFITRSDITQKNLPAEITFEEVLFLNEGKNEIKIVAYNDAGEANSEVLNVSYIQPKPEPVPVQVVVAEPTKEEKKEDVKVDPSTGTSTGSVSYSGQGVEVDDEVKVDPSTSSGQGLLLEEKNKVDVKVIEKPIQSTVEGTTTSDLLANLPKNPVNPFRFALIIGNEDYSSYQTGLETESDVAFAIRDASVFKEYALNILGVPKDNIIFLTNARAIEMDNAIGKLNPIIKALNGKAEIFFYYAGHGFPDEKTKEPYLIPVDVSGTNLRFAVRLKDLYESLTEHPSTRITVFLDACFSGGAREQGLVAARAVKVRPKEDLLKGNLVVFSASSGNESSLPYKDKQHGLFTYYLLEKLKETKGDVTYKELSEYLSSQVGVRSVMVNNKPQTPQTNVSVDAEKQWSDWKLK